LNSIQLAPTIVNTSNISPTATFTRISCRFYSCLGLSGGKLYGWGRNTDSQLGIGDNSAYDIPTAVYASTGAVLAGKTIIDFSAGLKHSAALTSDGVVAIWGYSATGALCYGLATPAARTEPVPARTTAGILATDIPTRIMAVADVTMMYFPGLKDFAACGDNSAKVLGRYPAPANSDIPQYSGGTRDAVFRFTGEFDMGFQSISAASTDGVSRKAFGWGSNHNCDYGWELAQSYGGDINDAGFVGFGKPEINSPSAGEDWALTAAGRCGLCWFRQTIPTIVSPSQMPNFTASIGSNITFGMNALLPNGNPRSATPSIFFQGTLFLSHWAHKTL
jgi:hypothetical protein